MPVPFSSVQASIFSCFRSCCFGSGRRCSVSLVSSLTCIAPALTFSNALGLSTTRELARRLEPSERDDARRFFASALLLAGAGGLPIAAILSLVGPLLARRVFHLDGQVAEDLAPAFLFGAGGWLCQCISAVFLALFTARQNYARLASIRAS